MTDFLKDVRYEMENKVNWPNVPDLKVSTIAVGITTIILASYVYGVDQLFGKLFKIILGF
ncbi:MAG: preprotein translocase subunit SecE [Calditrichaeota bacterium]|nr:MAG: preprotein translocase subunit SecE [Calditrichota bacterium]